MTLTAIATVTSKGQLTIPKAVRDAMGLHEGAKVRFEVDLAAGTADIRAVKWKPEDLASFAIPGARRMSFQEMEDAIRKGARR